MNAYKEVYDELIKCRLLTGVYDARHGNEHFMYGVQTVMEMIVNSADETGELAEEFDKMFFSNMHNSVERSREQ